MSAKVTDLPLAATAAGLDIYGATGGLDVRTRGGEPLGLATLDASGRVPLSQLPGLAIPAHTHDAADIVTGILAPARLGTGSANSSTFLRGDGVWAVPTGGGGGGALFVADTDTVDLTLAVGNLLTASVIAGSIAAVHLQSGAVTIPKLSASGSPDGSTVLRGDGAWASGVTGAWSVGGALTVTGAITGPIAAANITSGTIASARLGTGSANGGTVLRGDGTWAAGVNGAWSVGGNLTVTGSIVGNIAASQINSGVLATARLGTGSANGGTFLRGDGTWAAVGGGLQAANDGGDYTSISRLMVDADPPSGFFYSPVELSIEFTGSDALLQARIRDASIKYRSIEDCPPLSIVGNPFTAASVLQPITAPGGDNVLLSRSTGFEFGRIRPSFLDSVNGVGPGMDGYVPAYDQETGRFLWRLALTDGDKGDITVSGIGTVWTIDNAAVTIPKIGASGSPSASTFLRGDGQWAVPPGGIADGDKGDIVVSGLGAAWTIDTNAVTAAKIQAGAVTIPKIGATGTPSASTFLRGDGAWAASVATLADGTYGDIGVSAGGTLLTIVANAISGPELASNAVTEAKIAGGAVTIPKISASGTPSASTFLRGDGAWATPAGGGVSLSTVNAWTAANSWATSGGGTSIAAAFPQSAANVAGFTMTRVCAPSTDRAGSAFIDAYRVGGQSQNCFLHSYDIQADLSSFGYFDIGMTSLTHTRRMTGLGGAINAVWMMARSPSARFSSTPDPQGITHAWTGGAVLASEVNYGNSWADLGLIEDRRVADRYCGGLLLVPDATGSPYGGIIDKFHASFALGIAPALPDSSARVPKHHIGVYVEEDSIAPAGYMFKAWGGSSIAMQPSLLMKVQGHFGTGIDFTPATLNSANQTAVKLAAGQSIEYGSARIYFESASGRLAFFSPTTGVRYLDNFEAAPDPPLIIDGGAPDSFGGEEGLPGGGGGEGS